MTTSREKLSDTRCLRNIRDRKFFSVFGNLSNSRKYRASCWSEGMRAIIINMIHKQVGETWDVWVTSAIDIQRERIIKCAMSSSKQALSKVGQNLNYLGRLKKGIVERERIGKDTLFEHRIEDDPQSWNSRKHFLF